MAKNTLITYDNLSAYTENIKSKFAPKDHASTGTGYGLGTTSAYGHVKISNGDTVTAETANGIAAGMGHTHGNLALKTHSHGNISSEGKIAGAASRVVVTDSSGKITSSSTVTTGELDTLNVISGNTSLNSFSANRTTSATSNYSFAEGWKTTAKGNHSHAEGEETTAEGSGSHAEGYKTNSKGEYSHAEGWLTNAKGHFSHAEGSGTTASGQGSHTEGYATKALGSYSHAEGYETSGTGNYSHSEGWGTLAEGEDAHAEGYRTYATGDDSHAEGSGSNAIGIVSHAEGYSTQANGSYSHAEGAETYADGSFSHAEGFSTQANGSYSHAEGAEAYADGSFSHAEGHNTQAYGFTSHAEGEGTVAYADYSHACGRYNRYGDATNLFILGNGDSDENRSNAFMVDNAGYGYFAGDVLINASFDAEGTPIDGVWVSELGGGGSGDYAPKVHTATTSTYGLGTTSAYGHVKINNGDVATVSSANGLAAGMNHSHSNYSLISHTHSSYAPISHTHGNISNAGTLGVANRVVVTNNSGKITASSTIDTTELGYLNGVTGNIQTQLNGKAPTVHTATTTTYGAATTSAYGHVKISNGDVATVASANGLAAGMDHSHGNYALTSHTHVSNDITDAVTTSGSITPVSTSLVEGKAVFDYHTTSNNYGNLFPNGIIFNQNDWVGDGATMTLYENNTILRGTSSSSSAYPRLRGVGFANITYEVGKQYTLSFIARSSAPFTMGYAIDKNNGGYATLMFGYIKTTTSWKKYSLTATALLSGSTADGYGLQLYIATPNVKEGNRWTEFKEMRLEETNHVSTSGSTMYGKLVMGGQNTSNSVNSLAQIVFGDTTSSVALTSNGNGNLIVNPSTASTAGQIILRPGSSPSISVGGTAVSLSTHGHGNITSAGVITGAASRVVVTDANGKITSSSTITTTELGYLDGVTSAIQTQINGKASTSHTHGNISNAGVIAGAASRVVVTDSSGKITSSSTITTTELGYLDGVTGAIQTQINGKLSLAGGTMTGSIITPKDDTKGIIPHTNNYGSIGLSDKIFYNVYSNRIYATAITENGTALSSKYAPINHTHPNTGGGTPTPTISYHTFNMIYAADYPAATTVGSTRIRYNSSVGISYDADLFENSEKVQYNITIETGNQASSAMKGIVLDINMDDKTQGVPHFITVSSSVGSCILMRINIHDDHMMSDVTFCKTTTKFITGGTGLKSGETTSLFAPNTIYTSSSTVSEIRETSRLFINTDGRCTGHCMFYNQTNNATGAVTYMMMYDRYFGTYDGGNTSYQGNACITLTQL